MTTFQKITHFQNPAAVTSSSRWSGTEYGEETSNAPHPKHSWICPPSCSHFRTYPRSRCRLTFTHTTEWISALEKLIWVLFTPNPASLGAPAVANTSTSGILELPNSFLFFFSGTGTILGPTWHSIAAWFLPSYSRVSLKSVVVIPKVVVVVVVVGICRGNWIKWMIIEGT